MFVMPSSSKLKLVLAVVETTHPVDAEYSGGVIELIIQVWGGLFMLVSGQLPSGFDDFVMVAIPTWFCTVLMFAFYVRYWVSIFAL